MQVHAGYANQVLFHGQREPSTYWRPLRDLRTARLFGISCQLANGWVFIRLPTICKRARCVPTWIQRASMRPSYGMWQSGHIADRPQSRLMLDEAGRTSVPKKGVLLPWDRSWD